MRKINISEIISALFILLFVYAALSKLIDYPKFRIQLGQSPLLTVFAGWIAWTIPSIEICIAILLTTQRFRLISLYAAFSMMTIFSAYIVAITQFSEFVPCSCGGVLQNLTWNQHLYFNIFFLILGVVGIGFYKGQTATH